MEFICSCQDDELLHEWFFNGTLLEKNNGSHLVLERVEYRHSGVYGCRHPTLSENGFEVESEKCLLHLGGGFSVYVNLERE